MALRQRKWAWKQTRRLRKLLGGKCNICGKKKDLTFDLILPSANDFHHRDMEWSWRLSFYRREYDANNLQLLCDKCNSRKGDSLVLNPYLISHPF